MHSSILALSALVLLLTLLDQPTGSDAFKHGKHGHGHGKVAGGTACIVKGSYCSCHYCKCEKGWVHCGHKHGHGYGKKYCYGSMEGQYCHCDYCKCKHSYGSHGHHGKCH